MIIKLWPVLLLCIIIFPKKEATSQTISQKNVLLKETQIHYGSDPKLVNGSIYEPEHQIINGHPWFYSDLWLPATIIIGSVQYQNQEVKYDILSDLMVLNAQMDTKRKTPIILNNSITDSLQTAVVLFINRRNLPPGPVEKQFVAMPYHGKDTIVIEYAKQYIATYYNKPPFGKYTSTQRKVYLIRQGKYIDISRKRDILNAFNEKKKEVRKFIRNNGIRFSTNGIQEYKAIMEYYEKFNK